MKENGKKFIGIRVSEDKAKRLNQLASSRGLSLNELIINELAKVKDDNPHAIAVEELHRGIDQESEQNDSLARNITKLETLFRQYDNSLSKNVEELNALERVHDDLTKHRDELSKPLDGDISAVFLQVFKPKMFTLLTKKVAEVEAQIGSIGERIRALTERILEQATTEPESDFSTRKRKPRKASEGEGEDGGASGEGEDGEDGGEETPPGKRRGKSRTVAGADDDEGAEEVASRRKTRVDKPR